MSNKSHDWTGPDRVHVHVHCKNCGKIFEIAKAKGACPGKQFVAEKNAPAGKWTEDWPHE